MRTLLKQLELDLLGGKRNPSYDAVVHLIEALTSVESFAAHGTPVHPASFVIDDVRAALKQAGEPLTVVTKTVRS